MQGLLWVGGQGPVSLLHFYKWLKYSSKYVQVLYIGKYLFIFLYCNLVYLIYRLYSFIITDPCIRLLQLPLHLKLITFTTLRRPEFIKLEPG